MTGPASIHVLDDDVAIRTALGRLLRSAGYAVALYGSADELLAAAQRGLSGCILLDLRLPGVSGIQVQQQLAQAGCRAQVIFLTGHGDLNTGVRAMKQGALDFLEKPVDDERLLEAVAAALSRDAEERRRHEELEAVRARAETLTDRERQVWIEVVRGRLNKQIAGDLGIVERTVKAHRAKVMEKMRADSTADLVRMAQRLGL